MNIFQDGTKSLPKQDKQIVRVSMQENEIAGRKDHMPKGTEPTGMAIEHVGSRSGK